ncbi:MAG: zinc-binding dehydrogenase [Nitrospirae bacterium]|nr:zinc-binding dehydrogenase [Nitrospirota bacterium]
MRANLLISPGVLELREIETPRPSEGEILIKIKAALTCGTDLKAFKRGHPLIPMPGVFGHEFSGVIAEVGLRVNDFKKGMEVMAVHSAPCGECPFCRKGLHNLCEKIMDTKILGAFAEYILLPPHIVRQNVFQKPDSLSFEEAAFLEPLSCVVHGINSVSLSGEDTALIIGAGPIGLLHIMLLKTMGLRVIVLGKRKERLKKAAEQGADLVIDADEGNADKAIKDFTKGLGADIVFECTGLPEVWETSIWLARKGGTVVLFGGCKEETTVVYDTKRLHYDEMTLKGIFHYTPSDVKKAYKLLCDGSIKVRGLISDSYPLDNLKTALERLIRGEGIKYAIIP